MGKLDSFSIHFDPPRAVFFAGQAINGYVLVSLKENMNLRGISLELKGESYVEWRGEQGKAKQSSKVVLVNEVMMLLDAPTMAEELGVKNYEHPAGIHQHPFCIPLSQDLPSSFESKHGCIRYCLTANLEKAKNLQKKTKQTQCGIDIHQFIDPNQLSYRSQRSMETDRWISSSCCFGGAVHLKTTIPRVCFYPGDVITFDCDVTNGSRVNMGKVQAKLEQIITYKTLEGGTKTLRRDVGIVLGPSISSNTLERWSNVNLDIPWSSDIPPTIHKCPLICVTYTFLVCLGKGEYAVQTEFDILVGTVPYVAEVLP